jgi:hypothetical protein
MWFGRLISKAFLLEKIHFKVHVTIQKVLLLKKSGDIYAEKEELGNLDEIFSMMMHLLVDIEENLILHRS